MGEQTCTNHDGRKWTKIEKATSCLPTGTSMLAVGKRLFDLHEWKRFQKED